MGGGQLVCDQELVTNDVLWTDLVCPADVEKVSVSECVCLSHGGQETLLIPLDGGQSTADLQQRGSAQLRAARHQTPVILNPQAVQGLVAYLVTMTTTRTTTGTTKAG